MGTKCKTCTHPSRTSIERDFLQGVPITTVARNYGVGPESIKEHCHSHLSKRLVGVFKRKDTLESINMMQEFPMLINKVKSMLEDFERQKLHGLSLRAIDSLTKIYSVFCQFASVYYDHQSQISAEQREQADEYERMQREEENRERLSRLNDSELEMLHKLTAKMWDMSDDETIIPDPEPLTRSSFKRTRRNGTETLLDNNSRLHSNSLPIQRDHYDFEGYAPRPKG